MSNDWSPKRCHFIASVGIRRHHNSVSIEKKRNAWVLTSSKLVAIWNGNAICNEATPREVTTSLLYCDGSSTEAPAFLETHIHLHVNAAPQHQWQSDVVEVCIFHPTPHPGVQLLEEEEEASWAATAQETAGRKARVTHLTLSRSPRKSCVCVYTV